MLFKSSPVVSAILTTLLYFLALMVGVQSGVLNPRVNLFAFTCFSIGLGLATDLFLSLFKVWPPISIKTLEYELKVSAVAPDQMPELIGQVIHALHQKRTEYERVLKMRADHASDINDSQEGDNDV
jgi:hypothetical protein